MAGMIYFLCAVLICAIATFLVVHPKYEDGFIGRIALSVLAISEFVVIMDSMRGGIYAVLPTTLAIQIGFAGFASRHLFRFARWWLKGEYDWRRIRK